MRHLLLHTLAIYCLFAGQHLALGAEPIVEAPLSPEVAAQSMTVPKGFEVSLFAGEPDVKQPIGFCIDDRGRLWVAEAYNYPVHGTKAGDRILIFEDVDNDGHFDKRTVFYDKLNYVTGIEVGFGGVWVMSPPFFYFIPDKNGDDIPDGEPQVLLDGFGNHANSHNLANGFAWGPDGWLYGTHGRTNWSLLGKPGTPEKERVRFDGGVFRYHPTRHIWEPYADGTTNPWGIDWDDFGQGFVCNCVNPHLFHVIQGAHYEPWRNRKSSQHAYQRIETIADHVHYVGKENVRDGLGDPAEDAAGGGHAHCGTMIYLGGSWPKKYRNSVFMNNIHGHRINNDLLRQSGSGYIASHGSDFMLAEDMWYMGVTLQYGPDGSVFVLDWSDTGECHSVKNTRRHTGRIFKIKYGEPNGVPPNIEKESNAELVKLQMHNNDWQVRHARRVLQQRASSGQQMQQVHQQLHAQFTREKSVPKRLRALWALHCTDGTNDDFLMKQLSDQQEYIRAWAIQLLCEDRNVSQAVLMQFEKLAQDDSSPIVRRYLASALQRLQPAQCWSIAAALISHAEDASDQNLPLMYWYGIEPLIDEDVNRFVNLIENAKIPLIRRHIAQRAASQSNNAAGLEALIQRIKSNDNEAVSTDLLTGMLTGFQGRRTIAMPEYWAEVYSKLKLSDDETLQELALKTALIFNDPAAISLLREQAASKNLPAEKRTLAIEALVAKKVEDLAPALLKWTEEPAIRNAALIGLAQYNHADTVSTILKNYSQFDGVSCQLAIATLASRAEWGLAMLNAVKAKKIPRADLSVYTGRQLSNLGDDNVSALLKEVWGEIRSTSASKKRLISSYKKRLTPTFLAQADKQAGKAIYQKSCANCHQLFGTGGKIGPDLTGSQRRNLDYLLENLVDPSSAVSKDFQMQIILTDSGRVITGMLLSETEQAITIQTIDSKLILPTDEIDERKLSAVSMMPEGLLKDLSTNDVRNLIAYLQSSSQVPERAAPK